MKSTIRQNFVVALTVSAALLAGAAAAQEAAKPASPPTVAVPVSVAAAPVAGTETAKPEIKVTATKLDPNDPDTIVCKREADTGSRIKSTKMCASRRQWAEMGREISKQIKDSVSTASPN